MNSNTVKASSTGRAWQTRLSHNALVPLLAFAFVSGLAGYWQIVARAPALSFGDAGTTHFAQESAVPGEETSLCFDAINWHRLCPAETLSSLIPVSVMDGNAKRIDLDPHRTSTPARTGAVAPKCRPLKLPAKIAPGLWKLEGHVRADCAPFGSWSPVIADFPSANIVIRAQ